jgi:SAM-dependent methyltransferase
LANITRLAIARPCETPRVSQTYGDVDASSNPAGAVEWQRRMTDWPAIRAYKQRTYELVADANLVLDVGCGPGVDVAAIGGTRTVGVDPSDAMCEATRSRTGMVVRGDAHSLPFADAAFDAVRTDRVVQHLANPTVALDELGRVLRPGGRLVIADPDQESLVIQVPGVRTSVLDRIKALRRDVGYRNGRLVSALPATLRQLGFDDVTVDAFPLLIDDPGDAFGLPTWPSLWQARGGFSEEELTEWRDAIPPARERGFVYFLTFLVVAGLKR